MPTPDLLANTPYITPTVAVHILGLESTAGLRSVVSGQRRNKQDEWRVPHHLIDGFVDERTVLLWRDKVLAYKTTRKPPAGQPRRRNAGIDPTA